MLNSCDHTDSIVVYSGYHCPLCEAEQKFKDLESQFGDLENQLAAEKEHSVEVEKDNDRLAFENNRLEERIASLLEN